MVEVGTKVISLVLIVIFVVWLRFRVVAVVWVDFAVNMGTVIFMVILLRAAGAWGKPLFDRSLCGRTARFAFPAHGGSLAAYINYRVDELFIAALLPPEQLGFYVIAVGLVERLWILPASVGNALLPHLTNSKERDPALSAMIARHVMVWVGLACLVIFVLADVVIRVLYSSEYAPAIAPLRWLLPGIFTLSIGKVVVGELLARKKPGYTLWASSIAALINVVGNFVLVPRMGLSGAAIASSVSYSMLSLFVVYCYLWETGLPWSVMVPRKSDLMAYTALWQKKSSLFSQSGL
jgi:O-antigen/teichoic acid export membrane protein